MERTVIMWQRFLNTVARYEVPKVNANSYDL
jgi:hypothetical protein